MVINVSAMYLLSIIENLLQFNLDTFTFYRIRHTHSKRVAITFQMSTKICGTMVKFSWNLSRICFGRVSHFHLISVTSVQCTVRNVYKLCNTFGFNLLIGSVNTFSLESDSDAWRLCVGRICLA